MFHLFSFVTTHLHLRVIYGHYISNRFSGPNLETFARCEDAEDVCGSAETGANYVFWNVVRENTFADRCKHIFIDFSKNKLQVQDT